MKFRFDENEDLVLADIPDDLMAAVSKLASNRRVSEEDLWQKVIEKWSREFAE